MLNVVYLLDTELASPWPPHPVVPENQSCHVLCWTWHCPGHTHSFVQKRPSHKEAYFRGEAWCSDGNWGFHPTPPVHSSHHGEWHPIPWLRDHSYDLWVGSTHLSSPLVCGEAEKPDVMLAIEGSIQHHPFTPPTMVNGTPYHDWGTTVTTCGLDPRIYHLPLSAAHASTTITVKQREAILIIEDTVPPVPGIPPFVGSPPHTVALLVIRGQSGTPDGMLRSLVGSLLSMLRTDILLRNRRIIFTRRRRAEMKRLSWPFGSTVCLLRLWLDSSDLHISADVSDQCFGCGAKFCWRIIATHPAFLPLLAENSPQPTILEYAQVFAFANYAPWWPQRTIENVK